MVSPFRILNRRKSAIRPTLCAALERGFRTAIQGLHALSLTSFGADMRTLLVSDDLTADLISATGGNRQFVPFRESHKGEADLRLL